MAVAYYVLSTTERSILEANAPTADAIEQAMRSAVTGSVLWQAQHLANGGPDWVGPAPRITRTAVAGERFATRVAWPFSYDSAASQADKDGLAAQFGARVQQQLAGLSSDWDTPVVRPYSVAFNGPVAWWASGQGAVTMTRDAFPTLGGRLAHNENPIGPDTAGSVVPTVGQGIGQQASDAGAGAATDLLKTLGYVVLGGAVLYLAWPVLTGARRAASGRRR